MRRPRTDEVLADELVLDQIVLEEDVVQRLDGRVARAGHDEMAVGETNNERTVSTRERMTTVWCEGSKHACVPAAEDKDGRHSAGMLQNNVLVAQLAQEVERDGHGTCAASPISQRAPVEIDDKRGRGRWGRGRGRTGADVGRIEGVRRLAQQHGEEHCQQFLADLERLQDVAQKVPAPREANARKRKRTQQLAVYALAKASMTSDKERKRERANALHLEEERAVVGVAQEHVQ
jgi:hypothetical protein